LHVHSLPEGGGAEEDGVGGGFELMKQDASWCGAVEEEWVGELGEETLVGVAHLGVAGEEAEGAAFGDLEDAADALGGLLGEVGLAGVGHVGREVEEGLLFVIEVAGDDKFASGGEAETAADVLEAAGDREGGGGEDDRAVRVKEAGGEEVGDVDGSGLQVGVEGCLGVASGEVADSACGAALDPEDGVAAGGFEQEGEVGADVGGALAKAGGLFDIFELVEFAFETSEGVEDSGVVVAGLFEEGFAVVEGHAAGATDSLPYGGSRDFGGEDGEEHAGAVFEGGAGAFDGGGAGFFCFEEEFDIAGELVEALRAEADAEVVGGDVFELVGLVEDDAGSVGEDAGVGGVGGLLLDVEVGEEEVVVDDDDVRLEGFAAHGGDETALPIRAGLAETSFGAGVDFAPERGVFREVVEFGSVAGFGGLFPGGDLVELVDFLKAIQDWRVSQGVELVAAEVVGAALHVTDFQGAEEGFEEWDIFEEELLLEVFGAGGDDDALVALAGHADGG
jgi:hypothetical protein